MIDRIGVTAARHLLFEKATRVQRTDLPAATDCVTLVDRIDGVHPAPLRKYTLTTPFSDRFRSVSGLFSP
jgi:hypothetical protein